MGQEKVSEDKEKAAALAAKNSRNGTTPEGRLLGWIKARFGLTVSVLRPVPAYSMNPFYWLGALAVAAFVLQVVTGLLMLIYYVPTTDQAYSSTLFIIKYVPLGSLLETVHLYGAYAMILLTFLHLFRGWFVSAHKPPREMMWVIGVGMGFIVLGFGLTGYLLTWTVVSKSATDVSIGMLSFLPAQIGPILTFLMAGTGTGAAELTRFFDLHIVVLPAGLLGLLVLKMYMFEAHGAAEPPGRRGVKVSKETDPQYHEYPWFPSVYLYITMIGSALVAVILVASALFPAAPATEFSPAAAAGTVPQPEWYFMWIYQFVKIASFEGSGIYYALGLVTIAVLGLVLLPFIDRSRRRDPAIRPVYTTVGLILIAELLVLTVWGFFTPGQVIPDLQALAAMVGSAVVISIMTGISYRMRSRAMRMTNKAATGQPAVSHMGAMALPFRHKGITALFLVPLLAGSVGLSNLVSGFFATAPNQLMLGVDLAVVVASIYIMGRMLRGMAAAYRRSTS